MGSQLNDMGNEGERWTGGKLQHSKLIIKWERTNGRQEEEPNNDTLTLGHEMSRRRGQPHSRRTAELSVPRGHSERPSTMSKARKHER